MKLPVAESPAGKWIDRLVSIAVVGLAVFFVIVLAMIRPDARGHGTHEQLGMQRCAWPVLYDRPCPTCGVTTAAAHLIHLEPWAALRTQPFGVFLTLIGLLLAALALGSLVRGESFVARVAGLPYATVIGTALALLLASWGYVWSTWPAR